jgi:hypothetical protein
MPSDQYSCLRSSLCGVILPNQQPLRALAIGPQIDLSFAAITAFGLLSPAELHSGVPCLSHLLLARFFGWASPLTLDTRRAYCKYFLHVSLAGHCAHHWLLAMRIAYTSRVCLQLGIPYVFGCSLHCASFPSLLLTYCRCHGSCCLLLKPLLESYV